MMATVILKIDRAHGPRLFLRIRRKIRLSPAIINENDLASTKNLRHLTNRRALVVKALLFHAVVSDEVSIYFLVQLCTRRKMRLFQKLSLLSVMDNYFYGFL